MDRNSILPTDYKRLETRPSVSQELANKERVAKIVKFIFGMAFAVVATYVIFGSRWALRSGETTPGITPNSTVGEGECP